MVTFNVTSGVRKVFLADILTSEAEICLGTQDYAGAIGRLHQALRIKEEVLGTNHPSVALTLNNLASAYAETWASVAVDYAIRLIQRAIRIQSRLPGLLHPLAAISFRNLSWLYWLDGRKCESRVLCWWVYEIYLRSYGPESGDVEHVLDELSALYIASGKDPQDVVRKANEMWQALKTGSESWQAA